MLKLGNINISKVYIGSTPTPKGFLGEVQVWGQSTPVVTMTPDFVVHYYVKPEGETLNVVQDASHNIDKVGRYNLTTGQYEVIEFPAEGIVIDENEPFQYGFTLKNKTKMSMDDFMFQDDYSPNVREIDLHSLSGLTTLSGSTQLFGGDDPNNYTVCIPNTVRRFEEACCEGVTVKIWDNGAYRYGLPSGVTYIEGSEYDYGNGCFSWSKLWDGENEYDFVIPASVTHLGVGAFFGAWLPSTIRINSTVDIPNACFDSARCGDANWEEAPMGTVAIYIAEGNASIGNGAFYFDGQTFGISHISFPSTLRTIGEGAFSMQQFLFDEPLVLPDGLETIGGGAFQMCAAADVYEPLKVVIPSSVTSIGGAAFYDATIEEIHVNGTTPATLRNDYEAWEGYYPFDNCHTREDEETHESNPTPLYVPCSAVDTYKTAWSMYEDRISCQRTIINPNFDVYYQKQEGDENDWQIFNPALIALIDKIGVYNDDGECEEYDIPADGTLPYATLTAATIQKMGFILKTPTALDVALFKDSDFWEIDGILTTAPWTRVYNSAEESIVPSGFERLLNLPDTVQRVEDYGCAHMIVSLPDGTGGFEMSRLPSACTYIGDYAFEFAKLMNDDSIPFEIPSRITHIGEFAFEGAYLPKTINFNATIGVPDEFMFQVPFYVSNVNIAEGNTSIGTGAFHSGAIKDFSLPSTLRTIGEDAFYGVGMTDGESEGSGITIPAGVTTIGDYAFQNAHIPAIYFNGATPPTIGDDVFTDCVVEPNVPTPIYVPCSAVDTYKAAAGWSAYANQIQCIPSPEPDPSTEYFHFISLADGSQVKANSKFQYSLDGGNTWTAGDNQMKTLASGATIHFKGINSTALGGNAFGMPTGTTTSALEVRGNIMSLVYGDLFKQYSVIPADNFFENLFYLGGTYTYQNYVLKKADKLVLPATALTESCYSGMFGYCKSLTTAPELPATTLANGCYKNMFAQCTSLTSAPELPATTIQVSCYERMFEGCTSLQTAPELPATSLATACYSRMFAGCTSLQTAPELPALNLAGGCYSSMFYGCPITSAPELPATTLANNCYQSMFQNCTGLTKAPALPATTLNYYCYNLMFAGCTSLQTAPELPATTLTLWCYREMFSGCSSLNYIKAMFTAISSAANIENWANGLFPIGTFVKNANATYADSALGLPNAWTVETAEP